MTSFDLAHFSDTHLGYEAYRPLAASGHNLRGQDIVKAFTAVCKDIILKDPPLVIHSGDAHDRPKTDIVYMLVFQQWLTKLAGVRKDGTRRQVVVISGNHDQPRNHTEACFLELFRSIPGVHIVTNKYDIIRFDKTNPAAKDSAPVLDNVEVHALPHDQLKTVDFKTVLPTEGKVNIMTTHGVAGGSDLFFRSLGREYPVPTDVLSRDWDYVALGHWHKQGPVPLVSTGGNKKDPNVGKVWYAGSPENMSFRDLKDNGTKRGYLLVRINPQEMPGVNKINIPIRNMFRLPVLDATNLTADEITNELLKRVKENKLQDSIVGQIVENVHREIWSLVDIARVRQAAKEAMHYEITVKYAILAKPTDSAENGLGDLASILEERAKEILGPKELKPSLTIAKKLLGSALLESSKEEAIKEKDEKEDTLQKALVENDVIIADKALEKKED